jgi:hypothetical protein
MAEPKNITSEEIAAAFNAGALQADFPPILNPTQAARMLGISPSTLSLYTQMNYFKGATARIGKHRVYWRDRIIMNLFRGRRDKSNKTIQEENNE